MGSISSYGRYGLLLLCSCLHVPIISEANLIYAFAAELYSGATDLWMPEELLQSTASIVAAGGGGAPAAASVGYDDHKPRTPPPDLPSLLLDSRITYLGMPVRCADMLDMIWEQFLLPCSCPYVNSEFELGQFSGAACTSSDGADHC